MVESAVVANVALGPLVAVFAAAVAVEVVAIDESVDEESDVEVVSQDMIE